MNMCVKPSFDVATYLDHVKATHKRMICAVKDTAIPRRSHRVEVEEQHDEQPLPVEQEVKRTGKKSDPVLKRLAEIQDIYFAGISASEIAEQLGTTKNVVIGFYRRNPDELQSYPLVANPGAKAGARRKGLE